MKSLLFTLIICFSSQMLFSQQDDIAQKINATRQLRDLMQSDPHRPIYHFVAPEGSAAPFDPNGAIFWNGKYHLGYLYQKTRNDKVEHVWGHAVSTDLFHWSLYPDMIDIKDGDVEWGVFSGGAFLSKEGVPHIMYHGVGAGTNLVVYSTDEDLRVWKKFEGNPVLRSPAEGSPMHGKYAAWDPEGWYDKKADMYYQISGGNPAGFFKSKDMYKWDYLGDFLPEKERLNNLYEDLSCPDYFKIGDKQMLLFLGHYHGAQYYIGTFEKDKFTAEKHGRMNWPGGTFSAPEQLVDDKGRNIIWAWVLERKPESLPYYGWSGIMSMPRVLTLSKNNDLLINPPDQVKALRVNESKEGNINLKPNSEHKLKAKGKSLEIKLEMKGGSKSPYGVKVFCSPDGKEETVIKYDPATNEIIIDFIKSSVRAPVKMLKYVMWHCPPPVNAEGFVTEQRAPFKLEPGETLQLDIFIDRSIIEVFANGRQCVTQVVYPELAESTGISVFSGNEELSVNDIYVWEMAETNAY